jgi:hypothetical protein
LDPTYACQHLARRCICFTLLVLCTHDAARRALAARGFATFSDARCNDLLSCHGLGFREANGCMGKYSHTDSVDILDAECTGVTLAKAGASSAWATELPMPATSMKMHTPLVQCPIPLVRFQWRLWCVLGQVHPSMQPQTEACLRSGLTQWSELSPIFWLISRVMLTCLSVASVRLPSVRRHELTAFCVQVIHTCSVNAAFLENVREPTHFYLGWNTAEDRAQN